MKLRDDTSFTRVGVGALDNILFIGSALDNTAAATAATAAAPPRLEATHAARRPALDAGGRQPVYGSAGVGAQHGDAGGIKGRGWLGGGGGGGGAVIVIDDARCSVVECAFRRVHTAVILGGRAPLVLVNSSICEAGAAIDVTETETGKGEAATAEGEGEFVDHCEEEGSAARGLVSTGAPSPAGEDEGRRAREAAGSVLQIFGTHVEGRLWRSHRRPREWRHETSLVDPSSAPSWRFAENEFAEEAAR